MAMQPDWIESVKRLCETPLLRGSFGSEGIKVMWAVFNSLTNWCGWLLWFHSVNRKSQQVLIVKFDNIVFISDNPSAVARKVNWNFLWLGVLASRAGRVERRYLMLLLLPNQSTLQASFWVRWLYGRSGIKQGSLTTAVKMLGRVHFWAWMIKNEYRIRFKVYLLKINR